jgi:hypothetical protein
LNALPTDWTIVADSKTSKWLLKSFNFSMSSNPGGFDCDGTREQIIDFCLLRLRGQEKNPRRTAVVKKVLTAVNGTAPTEGYDQMIGERLRRGGFKDEAEWMASCVLGDCPDLAALAIETKTDDPRVAAAIRSVIIKPGVRGDVRAAGIRSVGNRRDKRGLLALCDIVEDSSPASRPEFTAMLKTDYPFSDRLIAKTARPLFEMQIEQSGEATKTIGDLAGEQLKKVAKKDFGKDSLKWRDWVTRHLRG